MTKKKIGLLALALVLALGALGVGYASWSDTIFVSGTVETGSVDLEIIDCSNTWVWKYPTDNISVTHTWDSTTLEPVNDPNPNGGPTPAASYQLISWADCDNTSTDVGQPNERKEITVYFGNGFPCTELTADFIVHYNGSIPAMVDIQNVAFTGDAEDLALLAEVLTVTFYPIENESWKPGDAITEGDLGEPLVDCPVQMHFCDYVYCVMSLNIPQQDQYMSLSGGVTAEIYAIQWNECAE
jgi:hypothetical protein